MSRILLHGGEDGIRAQRHAGGRPDVDLHLLPGHRHHHLFLAHVGGHPRPACQGGGNHFVVHDDGGTAVPQNVAGAASGQHRVQEEEQPCHHDYRADDAEQERRDPGRERHRLLRRGLRIHEPGRLSDGPDSGFQERIAAQPHHEYGGDNGGDSP